MILLKTSGWEGYELIDSGDGQRLERFGEYLLIRPDPQILWKKHDMKLWEDVDVVAQKESGEKIKWVFTGKVIPDKWKFKAGEVVVFCKLTPFKHTGVFPEQIAHWNFIDKKIKEAQSEVNILNLFGYTGISSLIAAKAGARVTHIDSSYPTIGWARENQKLSGLEDKPIRWILDDCIKFCEREVKRGVKYEGILMDPPSFGHGPKGERWQFHEGFPKLLALCSKLLGKRALFVIVNAYALSISSITIENILKDYLKDLGGAFESGELGLEQKNNGRVLSTGIFGRWSR